MGTGLEDLPNSGLNLPVDAPKWLQKLKNTVTYPDGGDPPPKKTKVAKVFRGRFLKISTKSLAGDYLKKVVKIFGGLGLGLGLARSGLGLGLGT